MDSRAICAPNVGGALAKAEQRCSVIFGLDPEIYADERAGSGSLTVRSDLGVT